MRLKMLLFLLVSILAFGSCAELKQFRQDANEFICNPPDNVVALAQAADPFIQIGLTNGLPNALPAYQAITAILSGGAACATITQINALISLLQDGKLMSAQEDKYAIRKLDPQPLMDWLAKAATGK